MVVAPQPSTVNIFSFNSNDFSHFQLLVCFLLADTLKIAKAKKLHAVEIDHLQGLQTNTQYILN